MEKKRTTPPRHPVLVRFGNRLKEIRKLRGYSSHEDFAIAHDIGRAQYGLYEAGRGNITMLTLADLLSKLNISFAEFFAEGLDESITELLRPKKTEVKAKSKSPVLAGKKKGKTNKK